MTCPKEELPPVEITFREEEFPGELERLIRDIARILWNSLSEEEPDNLE